MQTPITVSHLHAMKQSGEKIACLTAYDASFALLANQACVDVLLVGDSLGMVVQGQKSTIPVTMDEMIYHSQMVARTNSRALLMADMPFMSYADPKSALKNAARLMQEAGVTMVKLEVHPHQTHLIEALANAGVPVCAHLGLLPQNIHKMGAYKVQGREERAAAQLRQQAQDLANAGADCLLFECVPAPLASQISQQSPIPVIGIGAGADCDGQILVIYDILGISAGKRPKFSHDFLQDAPSIAQALGNYVQAVKNGSFPTTAHSFDTAPADTPKLY